MAKPSKRRRQRAAFTNFSAELSNQHRQQTEIWDEMVVKPALAAGIDLPSFGGRAWVEVMCKRCGKKHGTVWEVLVAARLRIRWLQGGVFPPAGSTDEPTWMDERTRVTSRCAKSHEVTLSTAELISLAAIAKRSGTIRTIRK